MSLFLKYNLKERHSTNEDLIRFWKIIMKTSNSWNDSE